MSETNIEETKAEIKSPYALPTITEEMIDEIGKITGCTSIFLVGSSEDPNHICTPEKCTGHEMVITGKGFTNAQVLGICDTIVGKMGMRIVNVKDEDEEDEELSK